MDKNKATDESTNLLSSNDQKYTLENPPGTHDSGFFIEANFLRHLKTGKIPNLEQYLAKLNCHDWCNLLAHNPRLEFIKHLNTQLLPQIDWPYVKTLAESKKEQLEPKIIDFIIEMEEEFKHGTNLNECYQEFLKAITR